MNIQYYTPEIEDFCVGYECEVNWSKGYSKDFVPIKLKICNELENGRKECYCSNVDEILIAYDDGYAEFRTPYLTREQIEAEGWYFDERANKFKHPIDIDLELNYDFNDHYLWITFPGYLTECDIHYRANKYVGNCPSINEFRKICKLLEI